MLQIRDLLKACNAYREDPEDHGYCRDCGVPAEEHPQPFSIRILEQWRTRGGVPVELIRYRVLPSYFNIPDSFHKQGNLLMDSTTYSDIEILQIIREVQLV